MLKRVVKIENLTDYKRIIEVRARKDSKVRSYVIEIYPRGKEVIDLSKYKIDEQDLIQKLKVQADIGYLKFTVEEIDENAQEKDKAKKKQALAEQLIGADKKVSETDKNTAEESKEETIVEAIDALKRLKKNKQRNSSKAKENKKDENAN